MRISTKAHQRDCWSEEAQLSKHSVDESIQSSQAQNGKDIASVHDEWVLSDTKDLH